MIKIASCVLLSLILCFCVNINNAHECGIPIRRHYRHPRNEVASSVRIIKGRESRRGAWPWQVSLQLLHPKYGFIGHWCGGVLIHPLWILTAAHCINNELFNLPVAALWTAVLGEWDRSEQSGSYVPVEKIILHSRYHHYQHDIALMKLSKSSDISSRSKIRIICLPESNRAQPVQKNNFKISQLFSKPKQNFKSEDRTKVTNSFLDQINNFTRSVINNLLNNKPKNLKYNIRVAINDTEDRSKSQINRRNSNSKIYTMSRRNSGRRSDMYVNNVLIPKDVPKVDSVGDSLRNNAKKLHFESDDLYDNTNIDSNNNIDDSSECFVTGWGRSQTNGSLTDTLLEASVPQLPIESCMGKYPENLPLRAGHLCAGNTDGSSGTCVGDSGGPLQCFGEDGRWVLKGITSFGSGCARPGIPDVYTHVPHYVLWINNVISNN